MYRPILMINVFLFNSSGDKVFIGKKFKDLHWNILGSRLAFWENFEDTVSRILSSETNIQVEDSTRIKFVCSYNAVDKEKGVHIVAIDYLIELTNEEENLYFRVDPYEFEAWTWGSYEEIVKIQAELCFGIQLFLSRFNIKALVDIKSLDAN